MIASTSASGIAPDDHSWYDHYHQYYYHYNDGHAVPGAHHTDHHSDGWPSVWGGDQAASYMAIGAFVLICISFLALVGCEVYIAMCKGPSKSSSSYSSSYRSRLQGQDSSRQDGDGWCSSSSSGCCGCGSSQDQGYDSGPDMGVFVPAVAEAVLQYVHKGHPIVYVHKGSPVAYVHEYGHDGYQQNRPPQYSPAYMDSMRV